MLLTDIAYRLCDLLGTAAFAISGAMVACRKGADLFGILFLAVVTAMGGGMLRDVLLGETPPALFSNRAGVIIALLMALLVFFLARYHRDVWQREEALVERVNNLVDALGLGLFAVAGSLVTMEAGYESRWFLVLSMGLITAVGGGLLRDIILGDIPFILTKHIYALAALAGSASFYLLELAGASRPVTIAAGVCVTFLLRVLATYYRWNLPKP
ncbi:MAG: trimeric intracellular cation channel family protein [Clostridiales bacterium]|nr:trimeric intracellular cation channel family protein [Clostridiales bacterium]